MQTSTLAVDALNVQAALAQHGLILRATDDSTGLKRARYSGPAKTIGSGLEFYAEAKLMFTTREGIFVNLTISGTGYVLGHRVSSAAASNVRTFEDVAALFETAIAAL